MQWPSTPGAQAFGPPPSTVDLQVMKGLLCHEGLSHEAAARSQPATGLGRSHLYDLAEMLLSELIPGWSDDGVEEDTDDNEEEEAEEEEEEEDWGQLTAQLLGGVPAVGDPVVDASYHACIREAERYLVLCEGLDVDGEVVAGLREHLHVARVNASLGAAHTEAVVAPRQRPPGYP